MLYDNAQWARVYLNAWQATGDDFFRTIAEPGIRIPLLLGPC